VDDLPGQRLGALDGAALQLGIHDLETAQPRFFDEAVPEELLADRLQVRDALLHGPLFPHDLAPGEL